MEGRASRSSNSWTETSGVPSLKISALKVCVNPRKRWYHQYQHRFSLTKTTATLHSNKVPGSGEELLAGVGKLFRKSGTEQALETGAERYISTEAKRCKMAPVGSYVPVGAYVSVLILARNVFRRAARA